MCSTATVPAAPAKMKKTDARWALSEAEVSDLIAMAWQDDTPFEAIAQQFGLSEVGVIALMREHLKTRSFRVWRMRVRGRLGKHQALQANRQPTHQATTHTGVQEDFPLPPCTITRQSLG